MAGGPYRILVTGSQGWKVQHGRIDLVLHILHDHHPDAVLVSGACPRGADALCEEHWWYLNGREPERHRPVWRPGGIYNPAAGFERSERMVLLGASVCVAFILPCVMSGCARRRPDRGLAYHGTHGGVHCADYAEDHDIPVRRFGPILAA